METTEESDHTIEMAAVGRVAELGELYDARRDDFLHLSLFESNLPDTLITSTPTKITEKMKYTFDNSMEEKFETMGISGELKLSILLGVFQLQGSGKYFEETKRSEKKAKVSLINSILTKKERISLTSTDVQSLISTSALEQIDCTHVVVGIQRGGIVFISVEDNNCEEKDLEEIKGSLMGNLQNLTKQISGKFDSKIDEKQSKVLNKYSFELFGDIVPDEVPQNLIEAIKFIKNVPENLRKANNSKGVAIKYSLIPISWIRKLLNFPKIFNLAIRQVDDATVKRCVRLFDDSNKFERKLNDQVDEVDKYQKFIATPKIEEVINLKHDYQVFQAQIQNELSKNLVSVRSGNKTVEELQDTLIEASNNLYSWKNDKFQIFELLKEEITFIKLMMNLNVTILPKDKSFKMFLSENYYKNIYLLFYSDEFSNEIEKPMHLFREILERRSWGEFKVNSLFTVAKNINLDKTVGDRKSSRLCLYQRGQFQETLDSDWLIEVGKRQIRQMFAKFKFDLKKEESDHLSKYWSNFKGC